MTALTQKALKELLSKEGQNLTLIENYNVWYMPFDEQERYPHLSFENNYARQSILSHPALNIERKVCDVRSKDFALETIDKAGKLVASFMDYPAKGNALLDGRTLTLKGGGNFEVGSIAKYLIYTVGTI